MPINLIQICKTIDIIYTSISINILCDAMRIRAKKISTRIAAIRFCSTKRLPIPNSFVDRQQY
ncbi:hypothetical protein FQR65_LT11869 [Abscondita terminalis]|nr:hypothetical protein FQR65_LT11869 [Abscondita terminalis]